MKISFLTNTAEGAPRFWHRVPMAHKSLLSRKLQVNSKMRDDGSTLISTASGIAGREEVRFPALEYDAEVFQPSLSGF